RWWPARRGASGATARTRPAPLRTLPARPAVLRLAERVLRGDGYTRRATSAAGWRVPCAGGWFPRRGGPRVPARWRGGGRATARGRPAIRSPGGRVRAVGGSVQRLAFPTRRGGRLPPPRAPATKAGAR